MITPAYSLTATERVLPSLAIDFTTAILDGRVTFSRALATATTVNASGYIETVLANTPRFDYDPVILACKGLLIEETRENRIPYSNTFSNPVWQKTRASITSSAIISPDGITTAEKLKEDSSLGTHYLGGNSSMPVFLANQLYTYSIYLQKGERTTVTMSRSGGGITTGLTNVNLDTGTLSSTGTAKIENAGAGWYRVSVLITVGAANTADTLYTYLNSNASYQGDNVSGVYVYGAQIEAGAFATSYIPTVAAALTRNADVATMTGTNFSDWYNATEGGAVVQVLPSTISGTRPAVEFDDNTANESIALRGVAADPQLFVVDGGATQATLDAGTIAANTLYKLGGAWKDASYAVALNGAAAVTQASGTFPTATQARLGSDGTNYLNGHLQSLRFWPQRLTNAEVQAFSK